MTKQLTIEEVYEKRPKPLFKILLIFAIVVVLFLWGLQGVLENFSGVNAVGVDYASKIFNGLLHPNLDLILDRSGSIPVLSFTRQSVSYLMFETFIIGFLGTILGIFIAIPFSFLASRNITGKTVSFIGNVIIIAIRTMPSLVMGLIFIRVVGPGAFAGVLAIGFSSVGMLSKLNIESIEDMNKGAVEALDSTGATRLQKIRFGILPQLSVNFISNAIYRLDINLRNATILGLVGAGGVGFPLRQAFSNLRWEDGAAYLYGIIIVVLVVELFSTWIRNRLINGKR